MIPPNVIGLVNNVALLMCLGMLYDIITFRLVGEKSSSNQIITGLILGAIGVAVMLNPWEFTPGVVFDTRSILLCITGFFFGTVPVVITIFMAGLYRFYIGGTGVWMGVAVIITSGFIGLVWRHRQKNNFENVSWKQLYLLGCIVHVMMLFWTILLPWNVTMDVLAKITLPVLLLYPTGTALMGQLMLNRYANKQAEKEIKNHNKNLKAILNSTPNILVLLNDDVQVEMINNSGAAFLGKKKENLLGLLDGEVFNCLNSFDGEGCGRNPDCSHCPVRTKVTSTFQTGESQFEEEVQMDFLINEKEISMNFLISTTLLKLDGTPKVLLSLADITKRKKVEEELRYRSTIETALTEVSNLFVSHNKVNYNRILQILGEKVSANRAYIFQLQENGAKLSNTFEWCAQGTNPQIDMLQDLETSIFPWWMTEMMGRRNIVIKNVNELPPEANAEKEILQAQQIYSLVVIPIWLKEQSLWGFMGFDDTDKARAWNKVEVDTLKIVGEMISSDLRRSETENKREFEREQFLSIFENIDEFIYITDPDTYEILYANQTLQKALPKKLIGKICYQALQGFESPCDFCTNDIILKQKPEPYSWEYHNPILNRDFSIIDRIIKWPDGRNVRFEFARDITDRKQNEKALKKSEKQFRDLFNSIKDLIYTQDMEGSFMSVNPAMNRLFGYDMDKFIGHGAVDFMESGFQSGFKTRYLDEIKKQGYHAGIACYFKENGEKIYLEYRSSLVHPESSESFISGIARDITEKVLSEKKVKQLQEQVAQSQKMESIGTLAGGIAHDFNNILFPIVGHTEMLLEDISENSPLRNSLNQIYTGAMRASDLVKQILTFSRQESGELKLMKMQPIIKEALKLIRSTIPTTIEIKQNISADCGVIKADPTQMHQIIMNLATNAYHAMEDTGGELIVNLKEMELGPLDLINQDMTPGVYACLSVADTGIGIKKELTQKIFDPFFTTKEKGKGTGMGLSVVHGIILSMNGAIQVYSETGEGTHFYVYLPVEKTLFEKQEIQQMKELIQGGTERILLVDDEDAITTMEKLMLERLGYQVTSRTSSIEALEIFRDNPDRFDMVITDMAMPNMSGDRLSAELIKIRSDIPVLLCTGFSETMSEEEAVSLGIKSVLFKPIVMKDLAQKIREVLDTTNGGGILG